MKTALSSPTKAHRERWRLAQIGGCIACRMHGRPGCPGDVHHQLRGGRRIGHDATVILCPWHHRGNVPEDCAGSISIATNVYGPSLEHAPRTFRATYGDDEQLLAYQNRVVDLQRSIAA